jgi:peptide/nickel transport system permease protein
VPVFAYAIRRVISGVLLLILMSMVTFVLFYASSSTPERFACGAKCTPAQLVQTKKALGYDQPLYEQWGKFAKGFVAGRQFPDNAALRKAAPEQVVDCPRGCLGYSNGYGKTVNSLLKDKLPVSVSLALAAFAIWITGGVLFGITAALFKGRLLDRSIVGLSLVAFAFPTFFIGLLFLKFVAIRWGIVKLPAYTPITDNPWAWATGLLLPAITLALVYMAGYIRMTRAFVLETMTEDYIRTARAKGLTRRVVIGKHTLRAVLTPLVTLSGLDLAGLLGGTIITEKVFNFNGVGKMSVDAIQRFDLALVVGIVLLVAAFVIVANIIVDLLYAVIDPRVRLG